MKPRELIGESPDVTKEVIALLRAWDTDLRESESMLSRIDDFPAFIRTTCFLTNMLLGIKTGKHSVSDAPAPAFPISELYSRTREVLSPETYGYESVCSALTLLEFSLGNKSSFFLRLHSLTDPVEEVSSLCDFFQTLVGSLYEEAKDQLDYMEFFMEDWLSGVHGMPEPY